MNIGKEIKSMLNALEQNFEHYSQICTQMVVYSEYNNDIINERKN